MFNLSFLLPHKNIYLQLTFCIIKKSFPPRQMDMPQDTPKKPSRQETNQNDQQNEGNQQFFSSFESNGKHQQESQSSIDQNGFKKMHTYKQKQLAFPQVPSSLGKLYQIYIHNVERKRQLKKAIEVLIEKQIKTLRISYDKQNFSIEEDIDLEQQSKEYKLSKSKYEERKIQLQKLARQYRELKIMHVQSVMVHDPIMKNTLHNYIQKNKQIIFLTANGETIFTLCKEKYKPRKIRKLKNKKGTKKTINQQSSRSEQEGDEQLLGVLQKASKSRNTSQTVSSDEENNQLYKYMFRNFKFYKSQNGVSFEPFQQILELPADKQYIGFVVEPISKSYIVYEQKKLNILNSGEKQLKIKSELAYDTKIIFCEIFKNLLYVGTQEGIMRVYQIKENCHFLLNKIALCGYGKSQEITHFALTSNPDIIVFVKKGILLCEMNLASYSGYLLSQLQEPIQFIDSRLILTKSCTFLDYYASGGSHGKAVLQHHQKLRKASKNRKLVKYHKHNDTQYMVFDEGLGVFSVENISEILKK